MECNMQSHDVPSPLAYASLLSSPPTPRSSPFRSSNQTRETSSVCTLSDQRRCADLQASIYPLSRAPTRFRQLSKLTDSPTTPDYHSHSPYGAPCILASRYLVSSPPPPPILPPTARREVSHLCHSMPALKRTLTRPSLAPMSMRDTRRHLFTYPPSAIPFLITRGYLLP
ncbi:uncharacterized protein FOMMEDRAFT_159645 [Fomitiporia mediterranea MF3/22]|uniref:uncharacterized protein n=1 Tax=Fomitiporia mediterranea (strain MF3/22) TaxID=694068 RepID=UPI0004408F18|nr:uncharacterized protein FOMMEDRAFT_159645 [Fomitiporia mediterranea MF3/22]EJD00050.1 hypothetical protein FOMMEDRAFT_159645 [Fomitiporia mediterranea MF3/22]